MKLPTFPAIATEQATAQYNSELADYIRQRNEKMEAARSAAPFLHPKLSNA
jgi:hypothetical protein